MRIYFDLELLSRKEIFRVEERNGRKLEQESPMLFMVIERFKDDDMVPIYRKLHEGGRMLPEGLKYIDSWVESNFGRCFQLMECDDPRLFQEWSLMWRGYGVALEIVPVVTSRDTQQVVASYFEETEAAKSE